MVEKLRVAVVGCGSVSQMHFEALREIEDVELVAACDIKLDRAQAKAEKYQTQAYTDYREVLEQGLDAIHICTPHSTHAEIAIAAMRKGIHVLTEKPMATTLADADRMITTAQEEKVKLGVIFQNRYNAASIAVKKAVDEGRLGKLLGCRVIVNWFRSEDYYWNSDWRGRWETEGGGALINQSIHTIDLMQWIMGDVASLQGSIANRAHRKVEVEDVAEARILFKNGAVGCLYATTYYTFDSNIMLEIHGEKGIARIEKNTASIRIKGEPEEIITPTTVQTVGKSYWGAGHTSQIQQFYAALRAQEDPEIDGPAGRKALEIVKAIYYSGDHGGIAVPFPFQEPEGYRPKSLDPAQ